MLVAGQHRSKILWPGGTWLLHGFACSALRLPTTTMPLDCSKSSSQRERTRNQWVDTCALTHLILETWSMFDKCTPLSVSHVGDRRGHSDLISGDAVELGLLQPVVHLPYSRLKYTNVCFVCCFVIVINDQPQLQKCECKLNPLLIKSIKAELNVKWGYTYLQIACPWIYRNVGSIACNVPSA